MGSGLGASAGAGSSFRGSGAASGAREELQGVASNFRGSGGASGTVVSNYRFDQVGLIWH